MGMLLRRHYQKEEVAEATSFSLADKSLEELKALAKSRGLKGYSKLDREGLLLLLGGVDGGTGAG